MGSGWCGGGGSGGVWFRGGRIGLCDASLGLIIIIIIYFSFLGGGGDTSEGN